MLIIGKGYEIMILGRELFFILFYEDNLMVLGIILVNMFRFIFLMLYL